MPQAVAPYLVLHSAFPDINEAEAAEMITVGKLRSYPEGKLLCREGEIETIFYILLKGEVQVLKDLSVTEKRVLKHLKAGDFFGEMALIHDAPRAATILAQTPVTVLEIHKDAFERLLRHSASLSLAMVREVSRRLRENDNMAIEDLRLKAHELADAYQRLAEQEFARQQFLTTIAHELRTPLTSASGYLHIVRSGSLNGEMLKSALETISSNLQQIVALVNDILFLQEMDLILPEFQPMTDINAVITAALDAVKSRAAVGGIAFRLEIASDIPQLQVEPKSLERALTAILDNAVKFSPDGGDVSVKVWCDPQSLWITVQDHGVGIPPDVLPRIFERFFHVDQVGKHLFRGAGLGLSIARQVIEQHGGEIVVESTLGDGATFTVRLRRTLAPQE